MSSNFGFKARKDALSQVLAGFITQQNRLVLAVRINAVVTMPTMPLCFAPSTGGIRKQSRARRNRCPPSTGFQDAFVTTPTMLCPKPQVLAGFTNNRGHGGIALPVLAASGRIQNHTHNAPSTGGIQNQSTARRIAFPQVVAVPRLTVKVSSSSTDRTTKGPDEPRIRACGVAGRCEERDTAFPKGSRLGRSQ